VTINLTDPVFTDEAKAREHLETIRWGDKRSKKGTMNDSRCVNDQTGECVETVKRRPTQEQMKAKETVMETKERDDFLSFLFDRDGCELVNIKFFRGAKKVTSEEICREAHRVLKVALADPKHVVPSTGRANFLRRFMAKAPRRFFYSAP
jgi:hypothetical protein